VHFNLQNTVKQVIGSESLVYRTKLLINLKVNYTVENTYERVIHN
jgi:hypothetical protein